MTTPQETAISQDTIDRIAAALESADIGHTMSLTRLVDGIHTYTLKIRGEIETFVDSDEANAIDQVYARIREAKHRLQAEAVIAALHAPLPIAGKGDDGWQLIKDAPQNQKLLVAYQNELGNWRIVTACYHTQLEWSDEYGDHEQEYAPEGWYEENDSSDVIYPTSQQPTHFRPLPAPPSLLSEEGSDKP